MADCIIVFEDKDNNSIHDFIIIAYTDNIDDFENKFYELMLQYKHGPDDYCSMIADILRNIKSTSLKRTSLDNDSPINEIIHWNKPKVIYKIVTFKQKHNLDKLIIYKIIPQPIGWENKIVLPD